MSKSAPSPERKLFSASAAARSAARQPSQRKTGSRHRRQNQRGVDSKRELRGGRSQGNRDQENEQREKFRPRVEGMQRALRAAPTFNDEMMHANVGQASACGEL